MKNYEKKTIQVIVIEPEKSETIKNALNPENYNWFPNNHTYSVVGVQTTQDIPEDFEGIIIIGDYPGTDSSLNKLAQTKWAGKTICIGAYSRKDHIQIGGFHWVDTSFWLTTDLPELINKIVNKI
jgi:hypothetical protein